MENNPKTNITLIERNSNGVLNELLDYNIHFGITTNEVTHKNINCVKLMSRSLSIVYSEKHKFQKYNAISITDFDGETLIQSIRGSQLNEIINKEIAKNQVSIGSTINVEALETALELVRHNIGIAILPTPYVRNLNEDYILYYELDGYEYLKNDMNIIFHKNRYLPQAVHDFIDKAHNSKLLVCQQNIRQFL